MKGILQEFGFYQGDTASPVYDIAFLLALMKFKQYANQHDPHLRWTINGHITEEHIIWSEQHRQWLQGPVIFPVMKSIFMSMAGFVAGMLEASVRIAEGIAYAFWHPIKTLQGISYAIWHWDQVAKHLWTEITTAYIEMVLYGNDFSAGKFYGEMTVEVLASVFTIAKAKQVAGAGHASKLLPSAVLGGKVAEGGGFLSLGSLTGFIGNISSRAKTFFNQLREGLKKHGDEVVGGGLDPKNIAQYQKMKEALAVEEIQSVVNTTKHGAERLLERVFSPSDISTLKLTPDKIMTQTDGAQVFIKNIGNGKFNVIVESENGVVTALKNIGEKSLNNLSKNYGWK